MNFSCSYYSEVLKYNYVRYMTILLESLTYFDDFIARDNLIFNSFEKFIWIFKVWNISYLPLYIKWWYITRSHKVITHLLYNEWQKYSLPKYFGHTFSQQKYSSYIQAFLVVMQCVFKCIKILIADALKFSYLEEKSAFFMLMSMVMQNQHRWGSYYLWFTQ